MVVVKVQDKNGEFSFGFLANEVLFIHLKCTAGEYSVNI